MRLNQEQMALRLNISTRTLRRYIKTGKLIPEGYEKNHPYYSEKQIVQYIFNHGKTKNLRIVWMARRPLNKVKKSNPKTLNEIVLTDNIDNFFNKDNQNLDLILNLLVAYKIKELVIDAAVEQRYTKEVSLFSLVCKKFRVRVKKEFFNNEN